MHRLKEQDKLGRLEYFLTSIEHQKSNFTTTVLLLGVGKRPQGAGGRESRGKDRIVSPWILHSGNVCALRVTELSKIPISQSTGCRHEIFPRILPIVRNDP